MAVGTAASIENWFLLAVVTVLFAVIYHYIILDEELKLQRIFKQPYRDYCEMVPRFFPRVWPLGSEKESQFSQINPEKSHSRFSSSLAFKNKAYEAYATFIGLIGFVALVAFIWKHLT